MYRDIILETRLWIITVFAAAVAAMVDDCCIKSCLDALFCAEGERTRLRRVPRSDTVVLRNGQAIKMSSDNSAIRYNYSANQ